MLQRGISLGVSTLMQPGYSTIFIFSLSPLKRFTLFFTLINRWQFYNKGRKVSDMVYLGFFLLHHKNLLF